MLPSKLHIFEGNITDITKEWLLKKKEVNFETKK